MKLDIREITDKELWDGFVFAHNPDALFQTWTWGEVNKQLHIPTWRYGFFHKGELIGLAQVTSVVARRGRFLHIRHGPVLKKYDVANLRAVAEKLGELGRVKGTWFFRWSPMIPDTTDNRSLMGKLGMRPAAVHSVDGEQCLVLPLNKSVDEILAKMRKTTRYEIRRSVKEEVTVIQRTDKAALKDFLGLYQQTSRRHGFVEHSGLEEEFELFGREGNALLILGYWQKKLYAGALILFSGGQAIYHHGASIPTRIPVSHFVQWMAIKEAIARGSRQYNFWGVKPPSASTSHPWHGLTVFKEGFGGEPRFYLHAHDFPLDKRYFLTRTIESVRTTIRGYR